VIFPFRAYPVTTPIASLGGRMIRLKPVVSITVIGPTGQDRRGVLLDSGADDIAFPMVMATRIGVNLSSAPQRHLSGAGSGASVGLLYAPVILELTDGVETCRWRTIVGFAQAPLRISLFGIAGGLEHFLTTFNILGDQIIMVPQPTLPVMQDPRP
jgi:hypothetical protein